MIDSFLHIILGIAYGLINLLLFHFLPPPLAVAASGSLFVFMREVGQQQCKYYNHDFRRGWAFWKWTRNTLTETFVPIAALLVGAMVILILTK